MLQVDVITIFPEMFTPVTGTSILKRAQAAGVVRITMHNLRDYTNDKRRTVDDRPYGGGPGMVMKPEPLFKAIRKVESTRHRRRRRTKTGCQIVLLAPQGERLTQPLAEQLARLQHLVLVCGRYEGIDERIRQLAVDRELSIGDYVLTGGELPAMVVLDSVVRLLPGAIGHAEATVEESFANGLLEYPHYTRPVTFRGMTVPMVLRSGDHEAVARWRTLRAVAQTMVRRPDLLRSAKPTLRRGPRPKARALAQGRPERAK